RRHGILCYGGKAMHALSRKESKEMSTGTARPCNLADATCPDGDANASEGKETYQFRRPWFAPHCFVDRTAGGRQLDRINDWPSGDRPWGAAFQDGEEAKRPSSSGRVEGTRSGPLSQDGEEAAPGPSPDTRFIRNAFAYGP